MASPSAVSVVVTSTDAPSTSPVIPPNRRTQWPTSAAHRPSVTRMTSGPCHGRGVASAAAAASATVQAATTHTGWEAATMAPSVLPGAAGTERRQVSTTATRPASTATTTAAGSSMPKVKPCTMIAMTTAATPNGPAVPPRITANARSGGP